MDMAKPIIRFKGYQDDWEQRKLGEVCEIKDSARIPNSEWSESGVPYIRASDVTNENTDGVLFISQERYEFYKNRTGAPTKDDVLFNGGGEIGKSLLITDKKPIYVQGGAVLYARTSKSRELVGQYLKTYFETTNAKSYVDTASAGGTMRHFTLKPSQMMRILMPSVEEQEKIGEYFANFDHLITLHQRKCDETKRLKKYMLQKMFPQNGEKVPEIRFSGFTDDWEQRKVCNITTSYSVGTPKSGYTEYYDGDIPFIRSGEIYSDKTELFITELGMKNSSAKMVHEGDILYALYGATSGEVSRAKLDGAINQAILAIVPNDDINANFLVEWFRKEKDKITDTYLQGGQGNLSAQIIKELEVTIPSYDEQNKIGLYFEQLNTLITLHQRELENLQNIKKFMLGKMFV